RPTGNENFTYKKRPFAGPSCEKLSNFLEQQQSTDIDEDTNDYYQIIHNSFLFELMKQSICISCKSIWNGDMSVAKREGTVYVVFSHLNSMKNATEEACGESNKRKLTVSGDGTWQKRGFSSLHGVVEIMSSCSSAKVRIR
ncbi:unnamed protein product, partial [Rotaria sp. Silwood2]